MKKGWLFSGLASLLIAAGTGGASWYVMERVPQEMDGAPLLAAAPASKAAAAKTQSQKQEQAPKNATLKEIINETQKKVVMIQLEDGSLGSGFLYNEKGDIITNAHVVEGARKVKVKTADARTLDGEVIGAGTDTDVAVVRVPELAGETPLNMAEKEGEVGDEVLALGSPLGLQNTVTTGIISGTGRDLTIDPYVYSNLYQISAPIAPGNSGGPLVDAKTGSVLGINSAKVTEENSIGFSIPVAEMIDTARGWSKNPGADLPELVSTEGTDAGDYGWSAADDAEYLVTAYYNSLSAKDYVTAYSFLGSSWQAGTDYNGFRDGYLNTGDILVNSISSEQNGDEIKVVLHITAEEFKQSGTVYTDYKLTYRVGYENGMLKIISGKGEKLS
ncbi:S1C family serine protease [Saccharibacillus alkalitolerans]|uniref:Trypsin-like serine protease n=1 Tax=Saccharibacillus alkalitolerans TaxID=2705290 RepID=A0ABX0F6B4_9BACL|nr:trypsin-like peptidase domain-containing protein [Saccharibacillus alkalitolerans]NGZ75089.1 trypsin-like serine protease [Saccharibacillus alkalitolerans]